MSREMKHFCETHAISFLIIKDQPGMTRAEYIATGTTLVSILIRIFLPLRIVFTPSECAEEQA